MRYRVMLLHKLNKVDCDLSCLIVVSNPSFHRAIDVTEEDAKKVMEEYRRAKTARTKALTTALNMETYTLDNL